MRYLTWSLLMPFLMRNARISGLKVDSSNHLRVVARRSPLAMSMASKAKEQLPATATRFVVPPDRILDIIGSVPQALLRLGSGLLVDGYQGKDRNVVTEAQVSDMFLVTTDELRRQALSTCLFGQGYGIGIHLTLLLCTQ